MVSPCPNASTYFIPSPEEFFKPKSWKQIQKDRKTVKKVIEIQKPHWNPQTLTSGFIFCFSFSLILQYQLFSHIFKKVITFSQEERLLIKLFKFWIQSQDLWKDL